MAQRMGACLPPGAALLTPRRRLRRLSTAQPRNCPRVLGFLTFAAFVEFGTRWRVAAVGIPSASGLSLAQRIRHQTPGAVAHIAGGPLGRRHTDVAFPVALICQVFVR